MTNLSPKYFRLYQEGFERSFAYGKAFIHQDQYSSPKGATGLFSTPKTPKSILKASRTSGFKSKKKICINESLNTTRRFSLRSEGSDCTEDREIRPHTIQTLDEVSQGQRFHTAPDASIDLDLEFSIVNNEYGFTTQSADKRFQTSLDDVERSSNLYIMNDNQSGMSESGILKSGLSETEKDYIRNLQKAREQQIFNDVLRKSEQFYSQSSTLFGNRSPQNSQTNLKQEDSTPKKNSYSNLHSSKAKKIVINQAGFQNKLPLNSPKNENSAIKPKEEKTIENLGKENAQLGAKLSPKNQKTISAKSKYDNLEVRIQQLREENKHLREKLDQKRKEEMKKAEVKTPVRLDIKEQNRFSITRGDATNYVARIIMSSQESRANSKLQKTPSASNLMYPRSNRPSMGPKGTQGMSSSSTGFYRSPDRAYKSGRNI